MIKLFAKNQNWAKACPWLGIITLFLLFYFFKPSQAIFWSLINIPLYLFHQTEELFHCMKMGLLSLRGNRSMRLILTGTA